MNVLKILIDHQIVFKILPACVLYLFVSQMGHNLYHLLKILIHKFFTLVQFNCTCIFLDYDCLCFDILCFINVSFKVSCLQCFNTWISIENFVRKKKNSELISRLVNKKKSILSNRCLLGKNLVLSIFKWAKNSFSNFENFQVFFYLWWLSSW